MTTKSEEIAHYDAFYAALPKGSYLRSILEGTPEIVAGMIRNDFGYPIGHELRKLEMEKAQLVEQIKAAGKVHEEIAVKVRKLNMEATRAADTLASIRREARSLANAV